MTRYRTTRRAALAGLGAAVAAPRLAFGQGTAPAPVAADSARPRAEWGAATGDVTADRAIVWSRADRTARLVVDWATDETFRDARRVLGPYATEAGDFTARVDLRDLPADAEVFYRVTFEGPDADRAASAPVLGRFRTAPASRRDVRFLWSGDTAGQGWGIDPARGGFRTYEAMRRTGADFFVHCGDTIYADGPLQERVALPGGGTWNNLVTPEVAKVAETLAEFHGRHRYNLMDANVRAFHAEVPQLWLWDDHEVTNNWSDTKALGPAYGEKRVQVLRARATRAFLDYAPLRPHGADEAERIYRRVSYGPHLDCSRWICAAIAAPTRTTVRRRRVRRPPSWGANRWPGCSPACWRAGRRGRWSRPTCRSACSCRTARTRTVGRASRRSPTATARRWGASTRSPGCCPRSSTPASATWSG